jgi:hypothetical protein
MCPRRGSIEPEDQSTSSSAHIKVQRPYTEYALVFAARDARVRHSAPFMWTLEFLRAGARIRLQVRTTCRLNRGRSGEGAETSEPSGKLCYGPGPSLSNVVICLRVRVRDAAMRTRQHGVFRARCRVSKPCANKTKESHCSLLVLGDFYSKTYRVYATSLLG